MPCDGCVFTNSATSMLIKEIKACKPHAPTWQIKWDGLTWDHNWLLTLRKCNGPVLLKRESKIIWQLQHRHQRLLLSRGKKENRRQNLCRPHDDPIDNVKFMLTKMFLDARRQWFVSDKIITSMTFNLTWHSYLSRRIKQKWSIQIAWVKKLNSGSRLSRCSYIFLVAE